MNYKVYRVKYISAAVIFFCVINSAQYLHKRSFLPLTEKKKQCYAVFNMYNNVISVCMSTNVNQ